MRAMAGALWLLLAALGSAAQEPAPGWLPEETLFCLSIEDLPRTRARLDEGRYAELFGDPAAQRISAEAKMLFARAREASLERGEVWLGSFWKLARGPLLLAVVRARRGEAPLVVMETEPGAFPRHLSRLADAGVLGTEIARRDGIRARPGGEGGAAVFWLERGGVVAFSWREDAVEEVLSHLHRGGRGFAPRLAAMRGKLRPDADFLLWLSREALAEVERKNPDLSALDAGADVTLGLTITLDPDALDVRAFVFAPRPRAGLLAYLDASNTELDAPPFLPPETRAWVAARFDLPHVLELAGVRGDETPLAKPFVRALGDRFALAQVGSDEVFLAEVRRERWMRRLLSAFPGGDGVREGPDGAVALRDGWLVAADRAAPVRRMLTSPATEPEAQDALPRRRIMRWSLAPGPPRFWDDPTRLFGRQEGALRNDADGLLLVHRALLR